LRPLQYQHLLREGMTRRVASMRWIILIVESKKMTGTLT
jgi:hypothetical protein